MRPDLICRDCAEKGDGRVKCWRTTVLGDYFHRAKTARQTHLSKDGTRCDYYRPRNNNDLKKL